MLPHLRSRRRGDLALLALAAAGFWPLDAEAAVLAFRNETDAPVMVQGMTVINRVARRGKLHLVGPGEVSQEPILVPGALRIIVVDAKQPSRVLCETTVLFTGADLFYAIQRDPPIRPRDADDASPNAKARKTLAPKVKLVPSKPVLPSVKPRR
jgi:hypothetical protein